MYARVAAALLLSLGFMPDCNALGAESPDIDRYLTEGLLEEGTREVTAWLEEHEGDNQARLGLGILQFVPDGRTPHTGLASLRVA